MPTNLPTDLLRSLVAIVDSGSMLKATETVFLTQSALSLQMKRLEELIQQPLFTRRGRRLLLTDTGQSLVAQARQMLLLKSRRHAHHPELAVRRPIGSENVIRHFPRSSSRDRRAR